MLKLFNMTSDKFKQKVQIVVTTSESVLLLKLNKERGGFWQNATGSVESNEHYMEAAQRELFEETGISAGLQEIPMEFGFHDRWGFLVTEKVFHCPLISLPQITLSEEHQDYKWVPFTTLSSSHYQFETHFKAAMLAKEVSR
jgi:8-oxo-dGTP pyrophosphatase MutT (NUDIX family)